MSIVFWRFSCELPCIPELFNIGKKAGEIKKKVDYILSLLNLYALTCLCLAGVVALLQKNKQHLIKISVLLSEVSELLLW